MNYTENYHLPQWAKSDRIMMEDFNQMCKDMEDGMTGNAQKAQNASQSSEALDKKRCTVCAGSPTTTTAPYRT